MNNIKLKFLKKYNKYVNNAEAKRTLENFQKEVNKLNYTENEINLVYLGGEFCNEQCNEFLMIFSIINTYHKLINYICINFSISILNSNITDINLELKPKDLGVLNYKEGVPLQLTIPIKGIEEKKLTIDNDQVNMHINNIKITYIKKED